MELLRGIQTRKSTRAFRNEPIPKHILERIIQAASKAPSYSNSQPWEVTVVAGDKKSELAQQLCSAVKSNKRAHPYLSFPKTWPEEIRKRSSTHMRQRWEAAGIRMSDPRAKKDQFVMNFMFFGAPVVMVVYMDGRLGSWSIFDLGLFVQTLVLAAHGKGVATCIEAMPAGYPEIICKCLGISSSKKVVAIIALGYEDERAPINRYQSERKPVEEWVDWIGL
jgi:nitroreductase